MELEPIDERPERIMNFSRPRPNSLSSYDAPSVRAMKAFHEPGEDRRDDSSLSSDERGSASYPRSSLDSDRTTTDSSAGSELAWDGLRGELVSRALYRPAASSTPPLPGLHLRDQRHPGPLSRGGSSGSGSSSGARTWTSGSGGGDSAARTLTPKSILKRSSAAMSGQHPSSRPGSAASSSADGIEDAASHHTTSEDGFYAASSSGGDKWSSSNYDISSLSEKERKKLEKKGINPALYLEMKAARAGKGRIGALTGNTYVS